MICNTDFTAKNSLSQFGEGDHTNPRAATVHMYLTFYATDLMEQHGKPLSVSNSPLIDFDAVCQKLRAALEPIRTHAVSLHDETGDVLWLSEGSMGPDEHNAVREAAEGFADANAAPILSFDLGDMRSAVMVRAINSRRAMVGMVMLIMDTRNLSKGATRLMTPKLQKALAEFAAVRPDRGPPLPSPSASGLHLAPDPSAHRHAAPKAAPPAAPRTSAPAAPRTAPAKAPIAAKTIAPATTPASASARTPAPAPAARAPAPAAPSAIGLTGKQSTQNSVSPEIDRLHAALRKSPIALHVQRLMPLTKGSQTKRYEVLLRSAADNAPNSAPQAMLKAAVENGLGSMIDRRVISELIGWLVRHPETWQDNGVMFSVNLTSTALHDEHFIKFIELCLMKSALPRGTIAFEIDAPTALTLAQKIADVATALNRLGCPLVLDDFALRTECFALLRLPGVRYVKLSSEITSKMRTDKIAQAAITGVVQMAHVLGMHTVAKRTETAAEQEWLTALGVDFIQSNSMSPPVAIDSLSKLPPAKI
jgi:EAL domain-containing protein (putative c-di-GMP-specific phosphodiesterase class I)